MTMVGKIKEIKRTKNGFRIVADMEFSGTEEEFKKDLEISNIRIMR